jgi:hypothetical protein
MVIHFKGVVGVCPRAPAVMIKKSGNRRLSLSYFPFKPSRPSIWITWGRRSCRDQAISLTQTKRSLTHSLSDVGTAEAAIADIDKKWDLNVGDDRPGDVSKLRRRTIGQFDAVQTGYRGRPVFRVPLVR